MVAAKLQGEELDESFGTCASREFRRQGALNFQKC
jgi:hypothetical protein